ncbi:MAG: 4'-phosphopantetheinyl transferase superfamily protein [Firmicutes bacterium]|nr:4'-phosphopantetheinyl transferase superfamily protein [Bacillota bacterium]
MNHIYLYDGMFEKGEAGWPLIKEAAARYSGELGLGYDIGQAVICRGENGKPFFQGIPVEFSLTHSGMMWMCMFSDRPCGLDLELVKENRNYESIAKRKYTKEEQHYVDLWGSEGFYEIWVRKEAFVKCLGHSIFSEMPNMVGEDGELKEVLQWEGSTYYMEALGISPEMKCAFCVKEKAQSDDGSEVQHQAERGVELRLLG